MVISKFNHIQGNNGSHWNRLMRGENAHQICIVTIDVAKFVNSAMICNIYGDILTQPFEFNLSSTGFSQLVDEVEQAKEGYGFEEVVMGIQMCRNNKYIVRIINEEREIVPNYTKTDNVI